MPILNLPSTATEGIQCEVHTSGAEHLADAFSEPSDWAQGSFKSCVSCIPKLRSAQTLVLNKCFYSIGDISQIYTDMILNKSTSRPRSLAYPNALNLMCKMEPPCSKPSDELDYEGQVWFEVPVSEHGNGTSETHTKTVAHKFLTDFGGPIAQCLENAKTGFTWDQSKDEVSYSDRYLTILAKRHPDHPERELAFVSFRRSLADEEDENESE